MWCILWCVLLAVGGFVAGALVYRNNAKKAEAALAALETEVKNLKEKVKK